MKRRNLLIAIAVLGIGLVVGLWRHFYINPKPRPGSSQGLSAATGADTPFRLAGQSVISSTVSGPGSSTILTRPVAPSSQPSTNLSSVSADENSPPSAPQRWVNSLAPAIRPSTTAMVFLDFQINSGQVTLRRQWKVPGNLRLPSLVVPESGIFHRLVTASGELLAQGITPDPRRMYYDYRDPDSGRAQGGEVVLTNTSFNVRYPWIEGADRVELYQVEAATDLSRLTPTNGHYYGSFKISTSLP